MSKNDNKLIFFLSVLSAYNKKLIQVLLFEILYSCLFENVFKNVFGKDFYKIRNNEIRTDPLPCPYYFLNKISKFINNNFIFKIIDLGSGTGRLVNYLAASTRAKVVGYEIDYEVFKYAKEKKHENAYFFKKDITSLNYKKLNSDCYILNAPLKKESDIKKLINKIAQGQKKYKKKYFLIVINIDSHLVEFKLKDIFKKFQMIKLIKAGDTKTLRIYQNKF